MNNHTTRPKLGILFLGRKRPGFDMEWGRVMESRTREWLLQSGWPVFEPAGKAIDDSSLRQAITACTEQDVDVLVLLQTTMGDGRLAPTAAQLWPDPLVLWATPEKPEGDMISSCSLVGTHAWASTLRQMGRAFEIIYGDPEQESTARQLSEAVRVADVVRRLRTVRLGVIGGQAPGYFAMGADPFSVHRGLGVQLQSYSLIEFANVVESLKEDAVATDVERVKKLGLPHKDTTDDDLPMASRLYLAMQWFLESENLDALSVRCWPEMPNMFGQWPYLGLARLTEEGRAVTCEGDADGALTAWMAERMGLGPCYLTDWLEHDEETITVWHIGAAPFSLCQAAGRFGAPRIARHFNIKKPAVVEATLREDLPITILRFWRCDGEYLVTAREAHTIKPRRHLMATNGLARLSSEDPRLWFEQLCHEGMPHHVVVVAGHHAGLLRRLARALHVRFV